MKGKKKMKNEPRAKPGSSNARIVAVRMIASLVIIKKTVRPVVRQLYKFWIVVHDLHFCARIHIPAITCLKEGRTGITSTFAVDNSHLKHQICTNNSRQFMKVERKSI
jgi:hypothetical protein